MWTFSFCSRKHLHLRELMGKKLIKAALINMYQPRQHWLVMLLLCCCVCVCVCPVDTFCRRELPQNKPAVCTSVCRTVGRSFQRYSVTAAQETVMKRHRCLVMKSSSMMGEIQRMLAGSRMVGRRKKGHCPLDDPPGSHSRCLRTRSWLWHISRRNVMAFSKNTTRPAPKGFQCSQLADERRAEADIPFQRWLIPYQTAFHQSMQLQMKTLMLLFVGCDV